MIVNVIDRQSDLRILGAKVKKLIRHVARYELQVGDEVTVHFVDTTTICALHTQFFNDPSPTDCISFPVDRKEDDSPYRVLGEIFICPATAIEYGLQHARDPYEEVTLYLVHGLMHLFGYNDLEDEECKQMRAAEERHMSSLKIRGLHLTPRDHLR